MFGTVVNALAIITGSLVGLLFRRGIPQKYTDTIMQAVSLAVILIGLLGALKADNLLLLIISLVIGSLIGEWIGIEDRLQALGRWVEKKFSSGGQGIARGFVTASLVFCVGSMAVVGSLESGLAGNHQTLLAKSMLDGISSIVFASSIGIGVMFSALPVFVYQGAITLTAAFMKQFLIPSVVLQMSAVGGLLIVAIGINLMEIKKIKVGNMLPAIFVPLAYHILLQVAAKF